MDNRKLKELETGKKTRGKIPSPPKEGPNDKDQYNFTDPESEIMLSGNKSFIQGYNAQICVEPENMFVMACYVTQNANDKEEIKPAVAELKNLPASVPEIKKLSADTGYYSDKNVYFCESEGVNIDPYIATGRIAHHLSLSERFSHKLPEIPETAPTIEKMRHKLKTPEGRAIYKRRKEVVEPVFGVIKSCMGFRQFSGRGLKAANGEWKLVSLAYNIKKAHTIINKDETKQIYSKLHAN
jgi:hypothetical protein